MAHRLLRGRIGVRVGVRVRVTARVRARARARVRVGASAKPIIGIMQAIVTPIIGRLSTVTNAA